MKEEKDAGRTLMELIKWEKQHKCDVIIKILSYCAAAPQLQIYSFTQSEDELGQVMFVTVERKGD